MPSLQTPFFLKRPEAAAVTIKCSGGTGVVVPNGVRTLIYCDGVDYFSAGSSWLSSYQTTLSNNGDVVVNATLTSAISAISTAQTGLVLNSATATASNYASALSTAQVTGLLSVQYSKINGATSSEQNALVVDDRRLRRRAQFVGF